MKCTINSHALLMILIIGGFLTRVSYRELYVLPSNWSLPLDLSSGNRDVGEVLVEEILFCAYAVVFDVLVPVKITDIKSKLLFVFLVHDREELVMVGVGPL